MLLQIFEVMQTGRRDLGLLTFIPQKFTQLKTTHILFSFFIGIAPEGVAVMTDIGQYLDFIIAIFLAFGIAFEVPVATFLLIAAGVTSADKLAEKRPYIVIGAFALSRMAWISGSSSPAKRS